MLPSTGWCSANIPGAMRCARVWPILGITLSDEELGRCYRLAMALADVKKTVNDDDILRLAREAQRGRRRSGVPVTQPAAAPV